MSCGSEPQPSEHRLGLSSRTSPHPESPPQYKSREGPRGPPCATKIVLSARKLQGFRGSLPESRDKGQKSFIIPRGH